MENTEIVGRLTAALDQEPCVGNEHENILGTTAPLGLGTPDGNDDAATGDRNLSKVSEESVKKQSETDVENTVRGECFGGQEMSQLFKQEILNPFKTHDMESSETSVYENTLPILDSSNNDAENHRNRETFLAVCGQKVALPEDENSLGCNVPLDRSEQWETHTTETTRESSNSLTSLRSDQVSGLEIHSLSTSSELKQENKIYLDEKSCAISSDYMEEDLSSKKNDITSADLEIPPLQPVESLDQNLENKENHSQVTSCDPYDLSADDDSSQERYRPIKRKLNVNNLSCKQQDDSIGMREDVTENVLQSVPEIKRLKTSHRVVYMHSQELLQKTNKLTRIEGRAELVHSLIRTYGLLQYLDVTAPRLATESELLGFHCRDYIRFLQDVSTANSAEDCSGSDAEGYGLSYDCPLQKNIFETASLISGATIAAAEKLMDDTASIAISWYGGWHHAKRDSASGFCYINDIVLGILKLRERFDKILYVDIDLHHGDGVEEAFSMTQKVMTISFHKYTPGFFPGSGAIENTGTGKGKFYSVNVPLLDGIKDAEFFAVFCRVMKLVKEKFSPQAVVLQCGADGLSQDPMASFNLTHIGLAKCVCFMLSWNLPTLLLGGGGYNFPNTARCWTFLTALAAGKKLPLDIPEHEHLLEYGPDYEMNTTAGNRKDCNTKQYLANLLGKISRNLSNI